MLKVLSLILFFSSVILIVFFFTNCKKGCFVKKDKNKGIIESAFDFGECFDNNSRPDYTVDQYIITNDSTYQALSVNLKYDFVNRPECNNAEPQLIDFLKHSLLGHYASGGCEVDFIREVTDDNANQRYIYTIKVLECGRCKKLQVSMNWVLVPKLPQGYTVKFEVK